MKIPHKNSVIGSVLALVLSLCSITWGPMSSAMAAQTASPTTQTASNTSPVKAIGQGRSDLKEIALTFDDGPSTAYTEQIMAVLKQYHAPATFFALGQNVSRYPGLIKEESANGFATENHSWDHPDLTKQNQTDLDSQLARTSTAVQQATGVAPTLMRPPYGAVNPTVNAAIAAHGMTPVLWDIDTEDWQLPGSAAISNTALTHAQNGAIVLMHDGGGNRAQTVAALPSIITGLQQKGYQLVTVPQLISA